MKSIKVVYVRSEMSERIKSHSFQFLLIFLIYRYSTLASTRVSQEVYKSQPGKIENYTPGKSSVVDKEAKQVISKTGLYNGYSSLHLI